MTEREYLEHFRRKFINDIEFLKGLLTDLEKCHDERDRVNLASAARSITNTIKDNVVYDFDARLRDDEIAKSLGITVNLKPAATGNHAVQGKE